MSLEPYCVGIYKWPKSMQISRGVNNPIYDNK